MKVCAHGGLIPALFAVLSNGSLVEQNLAVQTLANLRVEKANAAIINTQFFMMLPQLIILLNAGSLPTRTIIARALGSLSAQVVNLQAMIAFPPLFPALVGVLRLDQFAIEGVLEVLANFSESDAGRWHLQRVPDLINHVVPLFHMKSLFVKESVARILGNLSSDPAALPLIAARPQVVHNLLALILGKKPLSLAACYAIRALGNLSMGGASREALLRFSQLSQLIAIFTDILRDQKSNLTLVVSVLQALASVSIDDCRRAMIARDAELTSILVDTARAASILVVKYYVVEILNHLVFESESRKIVAETPGAMSFLLELFCSNASGAAPFMGSLAEVLVSLILEPANRKILTNAPGLMPALVRLFAMHSGVSNLQKDHVANFLVNIGSDHDGLVLMGRVPELTVLLVELLNNGSMFQKKCAAAVLNNQLVLNAPIWHQPAHALALLSADSAAIKLCGAVRRILVAAVLSALQARGIDAPTLQQKNAFIAAMEKRGAVAGLLFPQTVGCGFFTSKLWVTVQALVAQFKAERVSSPASGVGLASGHEGAFLHQFKLTGAVREQEAGTSVIKR